jgi:hypothetical protein
VGRFDEGGVRAVADKQEQLVAELEEIVKQLRQGKEESAVALTAELSMLQNMSKKMSTAKPKASVGKRIKRVLITLLVAAAAVAVAGGYLAYINIAKQEVQTIVTGVQSLAKLATAEAYVMTTLEGQDNKIFGMDITVDLPGTKRVYFVIVPAKMLAGVDLQGVTEDNVSVDPINKKVSVILPHATFIQEAIQVDKVKIYTDEGILRGTTTAKEGLSLVSEAQVMEKLRQEANAIGVLKTAEDNAAKTIKGFYEKLGYEVDVKFE